MNSKNILSTLLLLSAAATASADGIGRLSLDGRWEFRQANTTEWHEASVPGCVHTDLLALGMIPDPFYGDNEKHLQWIGEKNWEYRRTFEVGSGMLDACHTELIMEGVDTYAEVFINDRQVGTCDNMFRTWRFDVKPCLREGMNEIRVLFRSVFSVDMPKYLEAPYRRMAWPNNDQSDIWLSLYARKAGYNYGWDWGPRLITSGLWRSVGIESRGELHIAGTHIKTLALPSEKRRYAAMQAECTIQSDRETDAAVTVACRGMKSIAETVRLSAGENRVRIDFRIPNPRLWWCNGTGDQPLYDFEVTASDGTTTSKKIVRTGIRTVEIVREEDGQGRSMFVRLNGRPIFMKGANYIPTDNFPTRTGASGYEHIVGSAASSNMNILRAWGGGIYENDIFYELCDRHGILVWQDMMFACGMFPADEHYLQSVAAEVRDNVRRLRNHPSIALWNGNNENEISYFEWGWNKTLTPAQDSVYRDELRRLFYETIPKAIAAEDDTRYYHHTSPDTGYNGIGYDRGDVHFWAVWKGAWIDAYERAENIGRFMSEYGFQSYPSMRTLRRTIPADKLRIGSDVLLSHQRARDDSTRDPNFGDNMMRQYLERYMIVPSDIEDYVYAGRMMQAEAIKVGIEAHRRAKPYCMGSLYWQINDCWPVASWSSIDWFGDWKPLQYYVARAFGELLVSPFAEDGNVVFRIVSDRAESMSGELRLRTYATGGKCLADRHISVSIPADGVKDAATFTRDELAEGSDTNDYFILAELCEKGTVVAENIWYPAEPNGLVYPSAKPEITVESVEGGLRLTLRSPVLIRGLWLEVDDEDTFFTDNALTLVPDIPRTVTVRSALSAAEFEKSLTCRSLNEIIGNL